MNYLLSPHLRRVALKGTPANAPLFSRKEKQLRRQLTRAKWRATNQGTQDDDSDNEQYHGEDNDPQVPFGGQHHHRPKMEAKRQKLNAKVIHELLPPDIFRVIIFDFDLANFEDPSYDFWKELFNRLLVCKYWCQTFYSYYSFFSKPLPFCTVPMLCNFSRLSSLDLSDHVADYSMYNFENLVYLSNITQLKSLELGGIRESDFPRMPKVFTNLICLEKLKLSDCPQLITAWPPNLKTLHIVAWKTFDAGCIPSNLIELQGTIKIDSFPNLNLHTSLTRLEIRERKNEDQPNPELYITALTNLQVFKMKSFRFCGTFRLGTTVTSLKVARICSEIVSPETVTALQRNTNLTALTLFHKGVNPKTPLDLSPLTKLTKLKIASDKLVEIDTLSKLVSLKIFGHEYDHQGLPAIRILSKLPKLEALMRIDLDVEKLKILSQSPTLANVSVSNFDEALPWLQQMNIKSITVKLSKPETCAELTQLSQLEDITFDAYGLGGAHDSDEFEDGYSCLRPMTALSVLKQLKSLSLEVGHPLKVSSREITAWKRLMPYLSTDCFKVDYNYD
jgi:hypothetical protein